MNIDKKHMLYVYDNRHEPENLKILINYFEEMANYFANRYKISSFFRDDYKQQAVIDAFKAIDKYSPAKKSNPFSYFYKVIMIAFLYFMRREKQKRDSRPNVCSWDKLKNATSSEAFATKYADAESAFDKEEEEDKFIEVAGNLYKKSIIKPTMKASKKFIKSDKLIIKRNRIYSEKQSTYMTYDDNLTNLMIIALIKKKMG